MQVPDWMSEYAGMSGLALCGSLMRWKSWLGGDGKFQWQRILPELATAICLAVAAMTISDIKHDIDMRIVAGIAVFLGWLGPDAVGLMVMERLRGAKKP